MRIKSSIQDRKQENDDDIAIRETGKDTRKDMVKSTQRLVLTQHSYWI